MAQGDIYDMFDGVRGVIASFDDPRLLHLFQSREPLLLICHVVDAPESTYHTSIDLEVFTAIELALCFITKDGPVSACPEPSA